MLPRVSPLPEKRDITSYSSLHPHPGHPTIAPSLAEYPSIFLTLAQLSGLSITVHIPRPSSRSATDSARPSGYRDVERGLSGSPCQLLRIYENDLVPEPGGPFPPVRSSVTPSRHIMKTEDDASELMSNLQPAPADPTSAATTDGGGGGAATTEPESGADPDSHPTASSPQTARDPSGSPPKPHVPRRTVCDHCRRRRMREPFFLPLPSLPAVFHWSATYLTQSTR